MSISLVFDRESWVNFYPLRNAKNGVRLSVLERRIARRVIRDLFNDYSRFSTIARERHFRATIMASPRG